MGFASSILHVHCCCFFSAHVWVVTKIVSLERWKQVTLYRLSRLYFGTHTHKHANTYTSTHIKGTTHFTHIQTCTQKQKKTHTKSTHHTYTHTSTQPHRSMQVFCNIGIYMHAIRISEKRRIWRRVWWRGRWGLRKEREGRILQLY